MRRQRSGNVAAGLSLTRAPVPTGTAQHNAFGVAPGACHEQHRTLVLVRHFSEPKLEDLVT